MSQKSTTFTIRVSQEKLAAWKAGKTGGFNSWVVSALQAQHELDQAGEFERRAGRQERLAEIKTAFPQFKPASQLSGKKSYAPDPK